MKKTAIIVVLIWALLVSILLPFRKKAYADPMTVAQISSLAYALGNSFGLSFNMTGFNATETNSFFADKINSWLGDSTIIEKFGAEQARIAAGKLIVPYALYNGLREFIQSFVDENYIDSSQTTNTIVTTNGRYVSNGVLLAPGGRDHYASWIKVNADGSLTYYSGSQGSLSNRITNRGLENRNGRIYGLYTYLGGNTDIFIGNAGSTIKKIDVKLNGSIPETVLNPDKEWSGTINGEDWPDTNLDQLLGNINQDVADNNLSVEGEVIDVPPAPTPVPTIEPGDIDGYWNRQADQLEGLGNDIGDISGQLDDLGQQAGNITDALEGVNQGIQSQTGVISGALDQATQDVVNAIGEQTGILDESLTQTAEGVQEIADALQPGEIEPKQFDLRRLFPFCIPFDIHNLLQKFNAEPVAPHVQLPFVIQSIGFSYMFDLDFSAFDPVAAAMRTVEFIVFAIGLAWATSKVIKW